MRNILDINEEALKIINELNDKLLLGTKIADNYTNDSSCDYRDLVQLTLFIDTPNDLSKEEQEAYILREGKIMGDAFKNNDKAIKEKYLNRMYDLVDNFDYEKLDPNNKDDVKTAFICAALLQTIKTKSKENQDHFNERYNTTRKQEEYDLKGDDIFLFGSAYFSKLISLGIKLHTKLTLMTRGKGLEHYERDNYEFFHQINKADDGIVTLNLSEDAKKLPKINYNNFKYDMNLYDANVINNTSFLDGLFMPFSMAERELSASGLISLDMVFINGKSLDEIIAEKEINVSKNQVFGLKSCIVADALTSCKDKIELATFKFDNGQKKTLIHEIKPDVTVLEPKHSWFRLKFFNWGPFKITTMQDKVDKLYSKDNNKAQRHNSILAKLDQSMAEGKIKVAEAKEKSRLENKRIMEEITKQVQKDDEAKIKPNRLHDALSNKGTEKTKIIKDNISAKEIKNQINKK